MRRRSPPLLLAVALLGVGVLLFALSLLPASWWSSSRPTNHADPLKAELFVPDGAPDSTLPRDARREPSGYLTIDSVPSTPAKPVPHPAPAQSIGRLPGDPVPEALSGGIRLFARLQSAPVSNKLVVSDLMPPPQNTGRVILRDGCFHLDEPGEPHVVFTVGARLFLDKDGYLAVGQSADSELRTRIGETMHWEGKPRPLGDAAMLARIHDRCGSGAVQVVGLLQSLSIAQAFEDGQSATRLAAMYGLSWKDALARIRACRERLSEGAGGARMLMVGTPCGMTPPPPVSNPNSCPRGTKLSGGLCRTPEGAIRPIPPT